MTAVGIVVVSHSRPLARAAVALAEEMLHGRQARIEVAAGLEDGSFGTDAVQIVDAVTRADAGAGVVVLMDLGSAVLSAELALDLMDESVRGRVVLCPAPLVEGLVVAAVAAGSGAGIAEVAAEAAAALAGKRSHLGAVPAPGTDDAGPAGAELVGAFTVVNPHGLHARPAALLVQTVRSLDARVLLRNLTLGTGAVPAASLSRVATLGALAGHEVEVRVTGPQAREALDHVLSLAADGFGEETGLPAPVAPPDRQQGGAPMPAAPGIGIGPARTATAPTIDLAFLATAPSGDPAAEWRRLREAIAAVRRDVQRLRAQAAREVGEVEAAIFDAHLLLLDDPELVAEVRSRIEAGQGAGRSWTEAVSGVEAGFAAIPDPYLQARAADVRAVGDQVLRQLAGAVEERMDVEGVLVAADLTPAEAARLDLARTTGVVLAYGSPTAHSAILIRARGIPAVVGAGPEVLDVAPGTLVAVDGGTGELVVDPEADVLAAFRERADGLARRRSQALARAGEPARTRDGVHVLVGANVATPEEAAAAVPAGADLAGLVRTEFCFLGRNTAPDVDEQEAAYRRIAEAMDGRRITLRTLDVGGDKPLAYLPTANEANPFLGVRGIRLALTRPWLLAEQLLAAVRVAHDHPVDLMFPMITTLDELFAARRVLDDAIKLAGQGEPPGMRVGIMVEVPATALKAAAFAAHVDFLSVGTNDLTQYALAAERGNDAVASVADPLDPGVLQLVAAAGRAAGPGCLVAVCGELAADEHAAALLIGLGVRELSMAPRAVAEVKEAVRHSSLEDANRLAARALEAPDAATVRALLGGHPPGRAD
ncbi:phosphoenolpyruvate--protein phosphotransferase [Pseudonocardia sp.]|uniref:phosphoenolpyruvate--protein phosphotransferase n=1 Tax=Pseudonocardia sp. TaxID=60912 RepID=UPI003D0E1E39